VPSQKNPTHADVERYNTHAIAQPKQTQANLQWLQLQTNCLSSLMLVAKCSERFNYSMILGTSES